MTRAAWLPPPLLRAWKADDVEGTVLCPRTRPWRPLSVRWTPAARVAAGRLPGAWGCGGACGRERLLRNIAQEAAAAEERIHHAA